MGRLEYLLTTRIIFLMALGALAGCAAPGQIASNPQYAPPLTASQPLIGSTPTTLSAEFGQPTLLRVDGAAQVWLYHSTSCGLNLVLYPDASGTPRVAMVSTDGSTAPQGVVPADCTASLQQAHFDATTTPSAISASLPSPDIAALEHPASS